MVVESIPPLSQIPSGTSEIMCSRTDCCSKLSSSSFAVLGCLLGTAFHPGVQLHTGDSKGRTRQLAATIGARTHDFRCSAGDLAERRNGFDDHPALCIESLRFPVENIFDFISRAQF